jgi:hypothetical protein
MEDEKFKEIYNKLSLVNKKAAAYKQYLWDLEYPSAELDYFKKKGGKSIKSKKSKKSTKTRKSKKSRKSTKRALSK